MKKGYIITLVIIICLLLIVSLGFNFYTLYLKDVKCESIKNNCENQDCNCSKCEKCEQNKKNELSLPVEEGYIEVNLNSNQRKEINNKLLVFNVDNSWSLFPNYYTKNIGDDLFINDCEKASMALNYIYAQFFNQITNANYSWTDYYTKTEKGYYMNVEKVKKLAGVFFNKEINCNEKPFDSNYYDEEMAEGGWAGQLLKIVSKYQNDNNYYLILHLYDLDSTDECLNNKNDLNDCYNSDDDSNKKGHYFKLKYYKDEVKEYIISLEYLR